MALVGRNDGLSDTPLVSRTPSIGNPLHPCGGREARRGEPPQCVPRELVARDTDAAGVQHEPLEALGERPGLPNKAMHLSGRNLGALLGVASGISLGKGAGDDEPGNGQHKQ
jgi:hypothetical protein